MAERPKSPKPDLHPDHAAGTYSKSAKGAPAKAAAAAAGAAAQHENRFAEVTRKSREARERLNEASQARAERRESIERDRDYVRAEDDEHPAPLAGARSSVRGQRPPTTLERAAALLDGDNNEEPV